MKILGIDTSSKTCSVALVDNHSILAEQTLISSQTHSRHLTSMIDKVIELSGCSASEIDGFAVTKGPGSFTGLRIGISSVKGIAAALDKPVVGISSLEALALQTSSAFLICSLIDARRGQVYCARYRLKDTGTKIGTLKNETDETVLPPEKAVKGIDEPCIFIGDGAFLYKKIISGKLGSLALFASICQNTVFGSTVAYIGVEKLQKNLSDNIETLVPYYIRKPDANIAGCY